ncbi:aldolase/citrate lyase family protein [Alteribacillus sp. JSM 102045]|uniref:aldolase/citrate lyase family protein n=1 Tax=Alteribacillus sp. JSM 102045 TaxID=1562101 RepID=UPI0035BEF7BF
MNVHITIETALGVWNAKEIACASDRIQLVSFGAQGFCADTGIYPGESGIGLSYARSNYSSCKNCKYSNGGFFTSKFAIHPVQIPLIKKVFFPHEKATDFLKQRRFISKGRRANGKRVHYRC